MRCFVFVCLAAAVAASPEGYGAPAAADRDQPDPSPAAADAVQSARPAPGDAFSPAGYRAARLGRVSALGPLRGPLRPLRPAAPLASVAPLRYSGPRRPLAAAGLRRPGLVGATPAGPLSAAQYGRARLGLGRTGPLAAAPFRAAGYTGPVAGGRLGVASAAAVAALADQAAFSGPGMPYSFAWQVEAPEYGNVYDHGEDSDGFVTQGQYRVLLPDSRNQVVTYSVEGDSGYQADVTYEGEAQFPSPAESPVGLGPLELGAGASYSGLPGLRGAPAAAAAIGLPGLNRAAAAAAAARLAGPRRGAAVAGPSRPSTSYGYN